jgi:hypothetical protein
MPFISPNGKLEQVMLLSKRQLLGALFGLAIASPVRLAFSAERDDAEAAARRIMKLLGDKNFETLWEQTSDWYKSKIGNNKVSFVANFSISRYPIGRLKSSTIIDVQPFSSDPSTGFTGKGYAVTFQNSYETGNSYERIVVIEENGKFKMAGAWGVPA